MAKVYEIESVPARPRLAEVPLRLPIDLLLALPEYVTRDRPSPFDLVGALAQTFGSSGWSAATRVFSPRIWAPGRDDAWLDDWLNRYLQTTTRLAWQLPPDSAERLRVTAFPGRTAAAGSPPAGPPKYDIVHFTGNVGGARPGLELAEGGHDRFGGPRLRDWLRAAETRLLILHVAAFEAILPAEHLGRLIVGQRGPAVLVVYHPDPYRVGAYLAWFYGDLIHNIPLDAAAGGSHAALGDALLYVRLLLGAGGANLLRLDGAQQALVDRAETALQGLTTLRARVDGLTNVARQYLHPIQISALQPETERVLVAANDLQSLAAESLTALTELRWDRESRGAIPLATSTSSIGSVEAAVDQLQEQVDRAEAALRQEQARAPRVLNANFAEPDSGRMLPLRAGLRQDRWYDLVVDIGPVWDKQPSAVRGKADFPEAALPPGEDHYVIDVVVVGEDFTPTIAATQMWVPRDTGRSFPLVDGRRAESSGPVALRLRAPAFPHGSTETMRLATGRLSLYYRNCLLQSAALRFGVVRDSSSALDEANVIDVDFALTGGFQEIGRLGERRLALSPETEPAPHPVRLQLTLNSDGGLGHRLIVRRSGDGPVPGDGGAGQCPAEGWLPYDPISAGPLLDQARQELLNCFFRRDESRRPALDGGQPTSGLNPTTNGKSREQFIRDLIELARVGRRLYRAAVSQVNTGSAACSAVQWRQSLSTLLADASVIQVARARGMPAQYVFPWALVYEYPLDPAAPPWRLCPIVKEEWGEDGVRQRAASRLRCPYHDEHLRGNDICPYGFWGLKHVLEVPTSLPTANGAVQPAGAASGVRVEAELTLAVAMTRDAKLSAATLDVHLAHLAAIDGVNLIPATPAGDWTAVQQMLDAPEVVYFLCHGKHDPDLNSPYLGIGPDDADATHRIYVDSLVDWSGRPRPPGPDLAAWQRRRPLVFINGCHTTDLKPGQLLNFVDQFSGLEASGVLGTEVSVALPVAVEFAEALFRRLVAEERPALGAVLREVRWQFANKGNLLGLAYTLYGLADLHLVRGGA